MTERKSSKSIVEPDGKLWEQVIKNVQPLKNKRIKILLSVPQEILTPPIIRSPRKKTIIETQRIVRPQPNPQSSLSVGDLKQLDRSLQQKMKRGELTISATLDLHGLTQNSAMARLTSFLNQAYAQQNRCVLVITGKGAGGLKAGVLQQAVPQWLNTQPLRTIILAFCYAQRNQGGQGALYVLLKRKKLL